MRKKCKTQKIQSLNEFVFSEYCEKKHIYDLFFNVFIKNVSFELSKFIRDLFLLCLTFSKVFQGFLIWKELNLFTIKW